MKEDLLDIRTGIKAGHYVNKATVSQGIVQRLHNALRWPIYDTQIVAPECLLDGRGLTVSSLIGTLQRV